MKLYRLSTLAFLFFFYSSSFAQIGINTITPDSSASLHILSKPSGSGLIIPELTEAQRLAIAKPAVGLMVYDVTAKLFYMNMESAAGNYWYAINPWLTQGSSSTPNVMYTSPVVTKVGIGTPTPQTTLDVNGDIRSNATVSANTLNVTGFPTNALVPSGIITMWSGDPLALPAGWALCDGKTYGTLITPDLRGRFIVGAGQNSQAAANEQDNTTYTTGSKGGVNKYILSADESGSPAHTHTANPHDHGYRDYLNGDDANRGTLSGGAASATENYDDYRTETITVTINNSTPQNAAQAHENRPPYFVLAYIIKLP